MKIAVLGNAESWYVSQLQQAAEARGHMCSRVDFRLLSSLIRGGQTSVQTAETGLMSLDALVVRTMPPGSLEQVVYRMDVLQRLHVGGTLVLNSPKAIEAAVDKFLTTSLLANAGLPTPKTLVCEQAEDAIWGFEQLGKDVVVKPLFGAEGRGILRVSDFDLAYRVFRTLERTQSVLYLQEYIPHAGFDIRVLVLNGVVLGAMQRQNPDDFRTNVARKGIAVPHVATPLEEELALRATVAVGATFAGIDLLYGPDGTCYVIEVNGVPGWQAFQRVTRIQVADALMNEMEKLCC